VLLVVLTVIATLAQLPPAAAETGGAGEVEEAPVLHNTPFDRQGMWVWYVERSNGGSTPAIVAQAKRAGIGTGTWESLLDFTPYRMRWSGSRARAGTSSSRVRPPSRPLSAHAYEIRPGPAP
jgi:hypothetical protein